MIEQDLPDAASTEALGAALARARPLRDTAALLVGLHGELGAGKTSFARGFLQALGVREAVRSPTFSLAERYDIPGGLAIHADLYRIGAVTELEALGLREEFVPGALWLIEWPERAEGWLAPADLSVDLTVAGEGRVCRMTAGSVAGTEWLHRLRQDPSALR